LLNKINKKKVSIQESKRIVPSKIKYGTLKELLAKDIKLSDSLFLKKSSEF